MKTNKQQEIIKSELFEFVKSWNLIDPKKISLNTLIEKDLGMTGDDAIDFITDFAKTFNVNIESLDFTEYFGLEGVNFPFTKSKTTTDMTLKRLNDAIELGKLE